MGGVQQPPPRQNDGGGLPLTAATPHVLQPLPRRVRRQRITHRRPLPGIPPRNRLPVHRRNRLQPTTVADRPRHGCENTAPRKLRIPGRNRPTNSVGGTQSVEHRPLAGRNSASTDADRNPPIPDHQQTGNSVTLPACCGTPRNPRPQRHHRPVDGVAACDITNRGDHHLPAPGICRRPNQRPQHPNPQPCVPEHCTRRHRKLLGQLPRISRDDPAKAFRRPLPTRERSHRGRDAGHHARHRPEQHMAAEGMAYPLHPCRGLPR